MAEYFQVRPNGEQGLVPDTLFGDMGTYQNACTHVPNEPPVLRVNLPDECLSNGDRHVQAEIVLAALLDESRGDLIVACHCDLLDRD